MTPGPGIAHRVRVAEIVGPPGAGKSTVLDVITRRAVGVTAVRKYSAPRHVASYLAASLRVAPLLPSAVTDRQVLAPAARQQANWIVRLEASPRVLEVERARAAAAVLLDQGPAYTLVRLHPLLSDSNDRFRRWWVDATTRWADLLDLLVLLDAPDEVLAQRIRSRSKAHVWKTASWNTVRTGIGDHRGRCEAVAGAIGSYGGAARVVRLDTSAGDPDSAAAAVLAALGPDLVETAPP